MVLLLLIVLWKWTKTRGMVGVHVAWVVSIGFSVKFRGRVDLPRQPRLVSSDGDSFDIRRQEGWDVDQWTIGVIQGEKR